MSEQGSCPRGDSCNFAHSRDELNHQGSSSYGSEGGTGGGSSAGISGNKRKQEFSQSQFRSSDHQQSLAGYKSVFCNKFSAFGRCPYGDACTFAHSEAELIQNKRMKF